MTDATKEDSFNWILVILGLLSRDDSALVIHPDLTTSRTRHLGSLSVSASIQTKGLERSYRNHRNAMTATSERNDGKCRCLHDRVRNFPSQTSEVFISNIGTSRMKVPHFLM